MSDAPGTPSAGARPRSLPPDGRHDCRTGKGGRYPVGAGRSWASTITFRMMCTMRGGACLCHAECAETGRQAGCRLQPASPSHPASGSSTGAQAASRHLSACRVRRSGRRPVADGGDSTNHGRPDRNLRSGSTGKAGPGERHALFFLPLSSFTSSKSASTTLSLGLRSPAPPSAPASAAAWAE